MTSTPLKPEQFLDYDKSLACIHCGLCLASCPTYLETGNENDSPRGRIYIMRAVQDGRLQLGDTAVRHIDLCLGCRACEAVCPSGVEYGELLEHTRDHIEKHYRRPVFQRFLRRVAIEKIFPFPRRMKLALLPAMLAKRLGAEKFLPRFAREALSLVPDTMSEVTVPEFSPAQNKVTPSPLSSPPHGGGEQATAAADAPRGAPAALLSPSSGERIKVRGSSERRRVGFVSGCVMSVMFGETNSNSVRLLTRAGFDVVTPRQQVCCGALYAHGGNLECARDCARRNIQVFEPLDLDAIIINAAGCGSTLKEYHQLLRDDPDWVGRARAFSAKVKDLTEWLSPDRFRIPNSPPSATKVTYHDACHLAHPQHITRQPRELLKALVGEHFVELPESDVCCGSAGSYNLTEPQMAERLQKRKIENILKTGAQIIVTTNPGCILQMRAGLRKAGIRDVKVLHIADFLEERAAQNPE
jgi:glycolate oxidase iron-sulfur subunit